MAYVKEIISDIDWNKYSLNKYIRDWELTRRWAINRELQCFLIYYMQDRPDMGGTTNEFWLFFYRYIYLTLEIGMIGGGMEYHYTYCLRRIINETDTPQEYKLMNKEEVLKNTKLQEEQFLDLLSNLMNTYKRYESANPKIKSPYPFFSQFKFCG